MPLDFVKRHIRTIGSSHDVSVSANALAGLCANRDVSGAKLPPMDQRENHFHREILAFESMLRGGALFFQNAQKCQLLRSIFESCRRMVAYKKSASLTVRCCLYLFDSSYLQRQGSPFQRKP